MGLRYGSAEDQRRQDLREDFRVAINRNSDEGRSDTPDYVLADLLMACLDAFHEGIRARDTTKSKTLEGILLREEEGRETQL